MKVKYLFSITAPKKAALFRFAAEHGVPASEIVNRLIDGLLDGRIKYDAPPPDAITCSGDIANK